MVFSEGMYDPSEFEDLNVSQDIKELFNDILRYTPQAIDLETRFKPFIPEFIPAVGDIDAFIKVPRPDGQAEKTGLTVLDEPAAKQSDPSVLDLQLRAISKRSSQKQVVVKKVGLLSILCELHSTCPLVFDCYELSYVIFLKLRKKELFEKLSKFTK